MLSYCSHLIVTFTHPHDQISKDDSSDPALYQITSVY